MQLLSQAGDGGLHLPGRGRADMVAGRDRAFRFEHGEHVFPDHGAELPQFGQAQFRQGLFLVDGVAHGLADDFMRVAKGHAVADQIIGQVGGGGVAGGGGGAQRPAIDLDGRDQAGIGR